MKNFGLYRIYSVRSGKKVVHKRRILYVAEMLENELPMRRASSSLPNKGIQIMRLCGLDKFRKVRGSLREGCLDLVNKGRYLQL